MSFYHHEYVDLLRVVCSVGRTTSSVSRFIAKVGHPSGRLPPVILRHDVDRRPGKAVDFARLEAREGIVATYYFRCDSRGKFPARSIRTIAALGHEVGYHYECLSRCRGDRDAALEMFRTHLSRFRELASCETVSMHGAPLSRHDNLELLRHERLASYQLIGDAVLSLAGKGVAYFTDTGGRWGCDERRNLRDRFGGLSEGRLPQPGTGGFRDWLRDHPGAVCLSTHPERWSESFPGYAVALVADTAVNVAKAVIQQSRSRPGRGR